MRFNAARLLFRIILNNDISTVFKIMLFLNCNKLKINIIFFIFAKIVIELN